MSNPKCQIVDCSEEAKWTELWRIGQARAFVRVCPRDSVRGEGTRTLIDNEGVTRKAGASEREAVDAL